MINAGLTKLKHSVITTVEGAQGLFCDNRMQHMGKNRGVR